MCGNNNPQCPRYTPLIAAHSGAGKFSVAAEREQCRLLSSALRCGMDIMKEQNKPAPTEEPAKTKSNHNIATAAVIRVISHLELSGHTNAGTGSNLTTAKAMECDAALMDGTTLAFAGVAAVSTVATPIRAAAVALRVAANGYIGPRVAPVVLSGTAAADFARKLWDGDPLEDIGPPCMEPSHRALRVWRNVVDSIMEAARPDPEDVVTEDTVGAVALDCCGNISSGVSSGGVLLKFPGRIGEAAMFGCGIWAKSLDETGFGFGCSISGTGEQIIRTHLAHTISEGMISTLEQWKNADLKENEEIPADALGMRLRALMQEKFFENPLLNLYKGAPKNAGVICLQACIVPDRSGFYMKREIWYSHSTDDMCVGWFDGSSTTPETKISRKRRNFKKRKWRHESDRSLSTVVVSGGFF